MFIVLLYIDRAAFSEQIYSPYPIIFVHGFRSNESVWSSAKDTFEIYFKDDSSYKYPNHYSDLQYFPSFNYGAVKTGLYSRNGSIPYIAGVLANVIDDTIRNSFLSDYPASEKKVIIVAHSMGGLIARALPSASYSKIHKIIFIGTPHLGSPYASALWMINKEANEKLPPLIDQYSTFYSRTVGTLKFLAPLASPPIYNHISWKLQERLTRDKNVLWAVELWPAEIDPDGYAIDQMRIPFHSEYHDVISGWYGWQYKSAPIDIIYEPNETFLRQTSLFSPSGSISIRGKNDNSFLTQAILFGFDILEFYREGVSLGFNFPAGSTLSEAKSPGDGFVTQASQGAVGSVKDITASHINETESQEAFKLILQAIEDKPEIESVYAIPEDWNKTYASKNPSGTYNSENSVYYLIFKLKDYLLADIMVEKLDLITETETKDLLALIPDTYKENGSYKPYLQFKKYFLQERNCDGGSKTEATYYDINGYDTTNKAYRKKYLHLMPGEFYIKTEIPLNAQSLYIKIKNPADQYDSDPARIKFTAERTFTFARPKFAYIKWVPELPPGPLWIGGYYYTPYVIDIAPYDWCPQYDNEGNIIGQYWGVAPKDYEGITLSFRVEDSPYATVKLNVWLRDYLVGSDKVWRKFATNQGLSLTSAGPPYSGTLDNFATWYGEDDEGQKVPSYEQRTSEGWENHPIYIVPYRLNIIVEPIESPEERRDDKIPLLGTSGDIDYGLFWSDWQYRYTHTNIVGADPTFIQASRREGVSW